MHDALHAERRSQGRVSGHDHEGRLRASSHSRDDPSSRRGRAGMAGNVVVGGVVGIATDAITGASLEQYPNPIDVEMIPIKRAPVLPPIASGKRVAPKKLK